MSEMSINARSKAREKVERLTRPTKGDVDASGWKEPLGQMANVQTGPRPLSRRAFKSGGKVAGMAAKMHAGRKPRAAGGGLVDDLVNVDMKKANDLRDGPKHVGGMKKGGRARKAIGGELPSKLPFEHKLEMPRALRSGKPLSAKENYKVAKSAERRRANPDTGTAYGGWDRDDMNKGGRAAKASGGNMTSLALPNAFTPVSRAKGGKVHGKGCDCGKCGGGAVMKAAGGPATYGGSRPEGGRIARAKGGRAKKAMNVNIIIAPGGGGAKPPMPMPPPPGGPVGMHQGAPPPAMPPPGAGAPPPMGGPPPMMGRATGGRAYPIKSGGGGGLGRLEKARAYGE